MNQIGQDKDRLLAKASAEPCTPFFFSAHHALFRRTLFFTFSFKLIMRVPIKRCVSCLIQKGFIFGAAHGISFGDQVECLSFVLCLNLNDGYVLLWRIKWNDKDRVGLECISKMNTHTKKRFIYNPLEFAVNYP